MATTGFHIKTLQDLIVEERNRCGLSFRLDLDKSGVIASTGLPIHLYDEVQNRSAGAMFDNVKPYALIICANTKWNPTINNFKNDVAGKKAIAAYNQDPLKLD